MNHLISTLSDGIANCGDACFADRSPLTILSESIRMEAEHDAIALGEDPRSPNVRLEIASKIAALRLVLYVEQSGQTQGQVAAHLGISRGHINRLINGKAVIDYKTYQRLHELETICAILGWIDQTKSQDQKDHFETLAAGIRIADPYAKTLFILGAVFGEGAMQDWQDSTGTIIPIPAQTDAPEALSNILRKATA